MILGVHIWAPVDQNCLTVTRQAIAPHLLDYHLLLAPAAATESVLHASSKITPYLNKNNF